MAVEPVVRAVEDAGQRPRGLSVAHIVPEYLPRSATFIYALLANQERYRPLVLAWRTSNLDEFPTERVLALGSTATPALRDRLRSRLAGHDTAFAARIAGACAREGAAVAHGHFGWSGRDAVAATEQLGIPLVTTFYGRDLSEPDRARFRHPYTRLWSRGAAFVVEGPFMADRLAEIGAPIDSIRIVPIGIDLAKLPFAVRPSGDRFVALHAGRFVEKKGFDLSIRAFAAARHELGPSELWLVGDGPLRPELEKLVAELGVAESVHFAGLISHEGYRNLAARADVALQPSRTASDGDTEGGAPTVILEFQALGVPVVATRHADIPFVVPRPHELTAEDDVDGIASALLRIAGEATAERTERLREARAFVEQRHDARVTAALVEDVYEEVLA